MGQSPSQLETKINILNKTLNINNTDKCAVVNKNNKLVIGNCTDASNFTLKNGQLINDLDSKCVDSKLKTNICDIDSDTWKYDASTGYVKNTDTGKCLIYNNGVLNIGTNCVSFNHGLINMFTEKDRGGKCGDSNLLSTKLNYAQDDGKCNSNRNCSPLGICKDNDYRDLDYDSKYQYLYKKGKYDGLKTFTETDRYGKCGPSYLLALTKGYLPDSGRCDAGRYCSAFGECSDLHQEPSLINWGNAYQGDEVLTINNDRKLTAPESNYNIVYPETYKYFGNQGIYKKF